MNWLVFDFGPHFGDNFRGFLFFKCLKQKHPHMRLTCWITPRLEQDLKPLMNYFGFIDEFLVHPRSPRESYDINFQIIKAQLSKGLELTIDHLPGGQGPDGRMYDKIIPTAEVWFTAKLLTGEPLDEVDPVNQGEFLCRMLQMSEDEVAAEAPLFGQRSTVEDYICLGLCRPEREDIKQPAPSKIDLVWETVLQWDVEIYALDYQDWYTLPQTDRVRDWRQKSWADKVPLLNRSRLFIGMDGGLNHFAAACGCPTLSFFGQGHGDDFGRIVGPFPRSTPWGRHFYFVDFNSYIDGINAELSGGNPF